MGGFPWIPNGVTAARLILGIGALGWAFHGKFVDACWGILLCALLDALDGILARALRQESAFGRIFDSVADLLCFGALPPLFLFAGGQAHAWAGPVAFLYVGSAAFRLIRFHRQLSTGEAPAPGRYLGLPTTASGIAFAALALLFGWESLGSALQAGLLLVLAWLMSSRIRFANPIRIRAGGAASPATASPAGPGRSGR